MTDTTTYFGAVSSSSYTLNGYLCNIKYGNTLPAINVLFDLDYDFKVSSQVDSIGRVKAKTITTSNTQLTSDYSYYKTRVTSQTLPNNQTITYSYDPNTGNIIQEYFYENNERVGVVEYDYDEHGRLIYERRNTDEYTYEYDENGNITQVLNPEDDSVIQSFTYRSDNKNLILTSASATNTYQFGYTGNDITSITKNGTTSILEWKGKQLVKYGENEFKYDENGLRIQKKASTTTLDYVYEGDKLIQETRRLTSTGDVIYTFNFIYDTNGELVAVEENGELYFYIKDITGNIIKIVDDDGNDMVRYTYDAWGKLIQKNTIEYNTVTQANPFLYKGYYYDVETQLFYCNSRYYSPELCRFISPDSIEYLDPSSINGLNLYAYANNNPIGIAYSSSVAGGSTGGGMVNSLALGGSLGGGTVSGGGISGSSSPLRNLPSLPGWVKTVSTAIEHSFSIINPIRTVGYIAKYPNLWNLMRIDGTTELPGTLSKVATGVGWGIVIIGGVIAGYEKYASGSSVISSIFGGLINAGISIGGMYAATWVASVAMCTMAASIPGGLVVLAGASIAILVSEGINYLFTKADFFGNTIEGHLNDFVDWLIFWD